MTFVNVVENEKDNDNNTTDRVVISCSLCMQDVEKEWSCLETGEKVPLLKTAFSMTIKGITRCIFDDSFEDQLLVDKVSAAYMSAWGEMEVWLYGTPCFPDF